jgi:hypothetical protein
MMDLDKLPAFDVSELLESARVRLDRAQASAAHFATVDSARADLRTVIASYSQAGSRTEGLADRLRLIARNINAVSSPETQDAMLAILAAADMMAAANTK